MAGFAAYGGGAGSPLLGAAAGGGLGSPSSAAQGGVSSSAGGQDRLESMSQPQPARHPGVLMTVPVPKPTLAPLSHPLLLPASALPAPSATAAFASPGAGGAAASGARPSSTSATARGVAAAAPASSPLSPSGTATTNPAPGELGTTVTANAYVLIDPMMQPDELADFPLRAFPHEVPFSRYVSREERAAIAAEEERKRREAAALKDDAPLRALNDMMGGTLEGRDELEVMVESLRREPWMDTTPDNQLTPEQRAALAAYASKAAAIEEEKGKRRNFLTAEMNRLQMEIRDLATSFDERLAHLARVKTATSAALAAQEAYLTHLATSVQERSDSLARDRALEGLFVKLVPKEDAALLAYEAFKVQAEAQGRTVDELLNRDRALERSFRDNIRDYQRDSVPSIGGAADALSGGPGGGAGAGSVQSSSNAPPLDLDLLKVLTAMFKKRNAQPPSTAGGVDKQASSAGASIGAGGGKPVLSGPLQGGLSVSTMGTMPFPGSPLATGASFVMPGGLGAAASAGGATGGVEPSPSTSFAAQTPTAANSVYTAPSASASAAAQAASNATSSGSFAMHPLTPLTKSDVPDGYSSAIYDNTALWNRLNALRLQKIQAENDVTAAQRVLAEMQAHGAHLDAKYQVLNARLDAIGAEREQLAQMREVQLHDTSYLIRLRMGQDEVAGLEPLADYSDAMLLPAEVIGVVNEDIGRNGKRKIDVLNQIREFRRTLLYIAWERRYLQAALDHQIEYYRDLQLLRSSGAIGEHIKGVNVASKARKEADKAAERLAYMKNAHVRIVDKLGKSANKLAGTVEERRREVAHLDAQRRELEESVALRENILRTRDAFSSAASGTAGGGSSGLGASGALGPTDKMKNIATKTRLAAVAKAQASEIETLRKELDRLRQRTFPCFPATGPAGGAPGGT